MRRLEADELEIPGEMRRSEWLVRIALAFCVLYGAFAFTHRAHETFPFFAWDLFSSVPAPHQTNYSARIVAADGYARHLPVYFEDSRLQPGAQEIQGVFALQNLGKTIKSGKSDRADVLRRQFEATYFGRLSHVRYQIVERTYNIRVRSRCRTCFSKEKVIATYTTD